MPDTYTLNVFVQNNDYVRQLEAEMEDFKRRAEEWEQRYRRIAAKCADEQRLNLELISTLQVHGIRFRPSADIRTW